MPDSARGFVVLAAGHVPLRNHVIEHALCWLDRYLGPVRQATGAAGAWSLPISRETGLAHPAGRGDL